MGLIKNSEEFDLDPEWSRSVVLNPPNCYSSSGGLRRKGGLTRRTPESGKRFDECVRRTHLNLGTARAYQELGSPLVYRNSEDRRSSGWR